MIWDFLLIELYGIESKSSNLISFFYSKTLNAQIDCMFYFIYSLIPSLVASILIIMILKTRIVFCTSDPSMNGINTVDTTTTSIKVLDCP